MAELGPFVPGYGPADAKLIVIGLGPGEEEEQALRPFVGRTGRLTREMLTIAGIKEHEVYFTNVEKHRPPGDRPTRFKELGRRPFQDIDLLFREVEAIREEGGANCLLVLGEHAFYGVNGKRGKNNSIKQWRGSIIPAGFNTDIKTVPSYHPAALLRSENSESKAFSYSARAYMQHDFARAVNQAKFSDFRLPKRRLEYARDSDQLASFFHLYRDHSIVSIDIETTRGSCIPTCIGFAFSPYHGLSVPLLNIDRSVYIVPSELVKMQKMVADLLLRPGLKIIGQNFKFDAKKLLNPFRFKITAPLYFDTSFCAHILYPEFPKSLEFLTSVWTEEPYYKHELKEYDPESESFETVLLYNAKDVCVPYEIYTKMLAELEERGLERFFFDLIMPRNEFYMAMESRGFVYDLDIRNELKMKYEMMKNELQSIIDSSLGYHLDIGSYKKVGKALFEDLGLPKRKDTKEDSLVALLANHCKDEPIKYQCISSILELRKVNRVLNGPLAWSPDYDGKMRTNINVSGASNGRTSANILKQPERPTRVGFQGHNVSKHGEFGPELREAFKPDHGKILVQIDMSQAEARVVAALAKDTWKLSLFERGKDVHSITASWFFDKEDPEHPEDPVGVTKDERFIGKINHALNYDVREHRMMLTINKQARKFGIPINVSQAECRRWRQIYHDRSPNIEQVYFREIKEVYKRGKKLICASGRERIFFDHYDPSLLYSYIPSGSVADHNVSSAVRFWRRTDAEILLECHDSVLFQCEAIIARELAEIAKEEYERPMDLSRCSLPREPIIIPTDVEMGDDYLHLKKVHFERTEA